MFGGVKSELKTRTLPAGMSGHQMSFHYICGKFYFFFEGATITLCFQIQEEMMQMHVTLVWSLRRNLPPATARKLSGPSLTQTRQKSLL